MSGLSQKFTTVFEIKGEIGATFRKAMTGAAKDTNVLGDRVKSLSRSLAQVDRFAKGMTGIHEQRARYVELQAELRKVAAQMRATSTPSKALQAEFNKLTSATAHARAAFWSEAETLKKTRTQLIAAEIDTKKLTASQYKLQVQLDRAKSNSAFVDKFKVSVGRAGSAVADLRTGVTRLTIGLVGLSAAGYGIYRFSKDTAEMGESAINAGRAIGITGTQLQQTRYAMAQWGVETDQADASLKRLIRTTAAARDGLSAEGKIFQRLGLDALVFSKANGNTKLDLLADAFSRVSDKSRLAEYGMALFGKEKGAEIAEGLAKGVGSLSAAYREAALAGAVRSAQENEEAEQTARRIRLFEAQMGGLRATIGAAISPAFLQGLEGISRFIQSHQAQIAAFAKTFSQDLLKALPTLGLMAKAGLELADVALKVINILPRWTVALVGVSWVMKPFVKGITESIEGLVGFIQLVTKLGGPMLPTVGKLIVSLAGVIRTVAVGAIDLLIDGLISLSAAMASPAGLVIAGIAAIAVGGYMLIKNWKPIKAWFIGVFDSVLNAVEGLWAKMKSFFAWVVSPLAKLGHGIDDAGGAYNRAMTVPGGGGRTGGQGVRRGRDVLLPSSGSMSPNRAPPPGLSLRQGGNVTINSPINIHPHPGQSPKEIAMEVMKMLDRKQRDAQRLMMGGGSVYAVT